MQFKSFLLFAVLGLVAAQDTNGTNGTNGTSQDLNATLSSHSELSNLNRLVNADPALLAALGNASNITILAPSNEAFSQLLNSSAGQGLANNTGLVTALLQYHVLNGTYTSQDFHNMSHFIPTMLTNQTYTNVTGGQRVEALMVDDRVVCYSGLLQNSTVSRADVNFTGGVIHIIDRVLTLPTTVSQTVLAANLTAVYGALNATNFTNTIDSAPDLTIFAPTNEAFQSIGSVLANASEQDLARVLAYHVVNGTLGYSSDLSNGSTLQTLADQSLKVHIDEDGSVYVNSAKVIVPNVLVANGVVHVIDHVLNPNATQGPNSTATEGAPAFTGASSASNIPFTSGVPTPTTEIGAGTARPGGAGQTGVGGGGGGSDSGAAPPLQTGAAGAAALFGAGMAAVFLGL